jgi:UDPglucose 6-dehydrogenase
LLKEGSKIVAYDPQAMENSKQIITEIGYASSIEDALDDAALALILTEWEDFKHIDFSPMKEQVVFDTRHILNQDLLDEDVKYYGLAW